MMIDDHKQTIWMVSPQEQLNSTSETVPFQGGAEMTRSEIMIFNRRSPLNFVIQNLTIRMLGHIA